jgi:hypothetical protein
MMINQILTLNLLDGSALGQQSLSRLAQDGPWGCSPAEGLPSRHTLEFVEMLPLGHAMKLTNAATVQSLALPEGKNDKIFFDDELPGFGVRVRRTGGRTWMVQYAIAGRSRRIVLGPAAEERAIRNEFPKFNTTHNGKRHPIQELARRGETAASA